MENISTDLLILFALELNDKDLLSFCKSKKEINQKICASEFFWRQKLLKEFNIENVKEAKKLYSEIIINKRKCLYLSSILPDITLAQYVNDIIWNFDHENLKLDFNMKKKDIKKFKELKKKYIRLRGQLEKEDSDKYLKYLYKISQKLYKTLKFEAALFRMISQKEIPLNIKMNQLCEYNIYFEMF